jgi:hypothetical protein
VTGWSSTSDIYPGDWEFKVVGIYKATRKTVDRNTMVFRWDFFNNDPRAAFSQGADRLDDVAGQRPARARSSSRRSTRSSTSETTRP